jgi:Kef-type K+ transport system membrane component KefB
LSDLLHTLVALAAIMLTARAVGLVFRAIGQPAVMGEVVGGLVLGPSVLGAALPGVHAWLLPTEVAPFLGVHAQIGIILYMFLVGLELDLPRVRALGRSVLAVSAASIVVPFVLGVFLAVWLYPRVSPDTVSLGVFSTFIGTSLAVTAFPVLARILTDWGIARSPLGVLALTVAAVGDVIAWSLLAIVVGMARSDVSAGLRTFVLTMAFVVVMLRVAGPAVRVWVARRGDGADVEGGRLTRTDLATALVAVFLAATTTELIGIHGLFGAFLLGAVMPHGSPLALDLDRRLGDVVAVLFLPVFFAFTGMRTEIGLLAGVSDWLLCGAIVLVASAGKFGGTIVGARWSGLQWRDSAALGALMNTRGLVELIVLNIGLDLGIISPRLFTMLVIMALATTLMAAPLLKVLLEDAPSVDRR